MDDPEDLAVLEARDLLFARLLQYRAYKRVSAWFADRMAAECLVHARPGGLEDQFRGLLPEVTIPGGVERLARLAERAFTRAEEPVMPLDQLHIPQVSVAEQADIVLLGISQTSKTPTSIYLANRGIKTLNVPIVPGVPVPESVIQARNPLVVGLIAIAWLAWRHWG